MKLPDKRTITISGNTFPHKELFKSKFGLTWEPDEHVWQGRLNVSDQTQLISYCKHHKLFFDVVDWDQKTVETSTQHGTLNYYFQELSGGKIYCLDNHTTREIIGQREEGPQFKRTRIGELVYNFKYCNDQSAGQQIANELTVLAKALKFDRGDLIVPVPPTVKWRSSQPVLFIAKELAKNINVPLVEGLTSYNQIQQKSLRSIENKRKELTKVIGLTSQCTVAEKNVILVDDIYGTGLTIDICSHKLKQAKAKKVASLVVTKKKS